jgi:CheY-like chemotaxis protein
MAKKHILLVEDDPFQGAAIRDAIIRCGKRFAVQIHFTNARSEFAAREAIRTIGKSDDSLPDLYVVDLMLPWAKGDEVPDPDKYDRKVMSQGPLRAGYRVIEEIHGQEDRRRTGTKAAIILYTIADEPHDNPLPNIQYHHQQKSDDDNRELANLAIDLLLRGG